MTNSGTPALGGQRDLYAPNSVHSGTPTRANGRLHLVAQAVGRFLADERGTGTLEYMLVSAVTTLTSVSLVPLLQQGLADSNARAMAAFDLALEDAIAN